MTTPFISRHLDVYECRGNTPPHPKKMDFLPRTRRSDVFCWPQRPHSSASSSDLRRAEQFEGLWSRGGCRGWKMPRETKTPWSQMPISASPRRIRGLLVLCLAGVSEKRRIQSVWWRQPSRCGWWIPTGRSHFHRFSLGKNSKILRPKCQIAPAEC